MPIRGIDTTMKVHNATEIAITVRIWQTRWPRTMQSRIAGLEQKIKVGRHHTGNSPSGRKIEQHPMGVEFHVWLRSDGICHRCGTSEISNSCSSSPNTRSVATRLPTPGTGSRASARSNKTRARLSSAAPKLSIALRARPAKLGRRAFSWLTPAPQKRITWPESRATRSSSGMSGPPAINLMVQQFYCMMPSKISRPAL